MGRILSTALFAEDDFSTGKVSEGNAYMMNVANGVNPLTIHVGHFIDSPGHVAGELAVVTAQLATTLPYVTVHETGERLRSTSPDQVVVAATPREWRRCQIHIRACRSPGNLLFWEIQGIDRILRITSKSGFMHWDPLKTSRISKRLAPVRAPSTADCFEPRRFECLTFGPLGTTNLRAVFPGADPDKLVPFLEFGAVQKSAG